MAISHFIITKLPENVISKIGLVDIQIGQLYDITLESNLKFERVPAIDGFYLSAEVKFKAYDQSLAKYGNEAQIDLTWKENDLGILPSSQDVVITLLNNNTVIMLEQLPINGSAEFIEIVSSQGIKNTALLQGFRLSPEELLHTAYKVLTEGGGIPYFILKYKVGRNNILEPTVYSFTINVSSIAQIQLTNNTNVPATVTGSDDLIYNAINHFGVFDITKGYQGSTAQLQIDINCPFLTNDPANAQSEVHVEINGILNIYTANQLINTSVDLNSLGKANIQIQHKIVTNNVAQQGTTTITLLSINNDTTIVSPTINSAALTSNF